jgi:hypothetical protein
VKRRSSPCGAKRLQCYLADSPDPASLDSFEL